MNKNVSALSLLFPLVLAGCGLASDPNNEQPVVDTVAPRVLGFSPLQNTTLNGIEPPPITITFNEAIDPDTIQGSLSIKSDAAGATEIPVEVTYNADTLTLTYTAKSNLEYNQRYIVTLSSAITDTAGNTLVEPFAWAFSTPKTYNVSIVSQGLVSGNSVTVTNGVNQDELVINSNTASTFTNRLFDGEGYSLRITNQPADGGQYCALSNAVGAITGSSVSVSLTCGTVGPAYPQNGANWNDYVKNDGASRLAASGAYCDEYGHGYGSCVHGGEMRAVTVSADKATSCAGLTATDDLGAFDWACVEDNSGIRMVSTNLKSNKRLADLIDFANLAWKKNAVTVTGPEGRVLLTTSSIWWNNPVLAPTSSTLTRAAGYVVGEAATVYVIAADTTAYYNIADSSIALVIKPGATLYGSSPNREVIAASNRHFIWLEGQIDAGSNGTRGIWIQNGWYPVLRHLSVSNTSSDGIWLSSNQSTFAGNGYLADVSASQNTGDGIAVDVGYTTLVNVNAASNTGSGIVLSRDANTIQGATVADNGESGIKVSDSLENVLVDIAAFNNGIHGVALMGARNSRLADITVSGNENSGLMLTTAGTSAAYTVASDNNVINALTAVDNGDAGVYVDGAAKGNRFSSLALAANGNTAIMLNDQANTLENVTAGNSGGASDCVEPTGSVCATLTTGTDMTASFAGAADMSARDDLNSLRFVYYNTMSGKWLDLASRNQAWNAASDPFATPGAAGTGRCDADSSQFHCAIFDWSLLSTDGILLRALTDTAAEATQTWLTADASTSTSTYLANAIEVMGDGIGNDDALCESGETCLSMPNIGSYQGHLPSGETLQNIDVTLATLTGITLLGYPSNGY